MTQHNMTRRAILDGLSLMGLTAWEGAASLDHTGHRRLSQPRLWMLREVGGTAEICGL